MSAPCTQSVSGMAGSCPSVLALAFALAALAGCGGEETPQKDAGPEAQPQRVDVEQYELKKRLLVVFTEGPDDPQYATFQQRWADAAEGMAERDLKLIVVHQGRPVEIDGKTEPPAAGAQLRREYGVLPMSFSIQLVGKDGQVKLSRDEGVGPEVIFDRIDEMPMRQAEMQRRGQ